MAFLVALFAVENFDHFFLQYSGVRCSDFWCSCSLYFHPIVAFHMTLEHGLHVERFRTQFAEQEILEEVSIFQMNLQ